MRTTLDMPDDLMRHLKARAALEGRSLRDVTLKLIKRGLRMPAAALLAEAALPTLASELRCRPWRSVIRIRA